MPRKILSPEDARLAQVYKAAGEATSMLAGEIEMCQQALRESLDRAAQQTMKYDSRAPDHFYQAMQLVEASAKLAEALAKVKGEVHQHIRIERTDGKEA